MKAISFSYEWHLSPKIDPLPEVREEGKESQEVKSTPMVVPQLKKKNSGAKANIIYLWLTQASHRLLAVLLTSCDPLTHRTSTAFRGPLSEQSLLSENTPFSWLVPQTRREICLWSYPRRAFRIWEDCGIKCFKKYLRPFLCWRHRSEVHNSASREE